MWRVIGQEFSRLMARTFGPSAAKWAEENDIPFMGILALFLFIGLAWATFQVGREEIVGQPIEERRRNKQYGRWTAIVTLGVGVTLLGTSWTLGSFEQKQLQEVVCSLAAGALGSVVCLLWLGWRGKGWTRWGRWRMRAIVPMPLFLGVYLAVFASNRLSPPPPPPSPEEEAKAVAVIRQYGGSVSVIDWKSNSPRVVVFRKRSEMGFEERPKGAPPGPRIFTHTEVPLRDDDLPPLLEAFRVLQKLTILDLSDTALTPAGVERVRAVVPNATVTGPAK